MKIGCSYMTYYGITTIVKSILAHRKIFDYICVVHQTKGIFCNEDDGGMLLILQELRHKNLIDDFVIYNNDSNKPIECYILDKRNIGLKMCVDVGCAYIVPLDSDEIYTKELVDEIKQNPNIDTFYSPIRTYYVEPTKYFDEEYFVPSAYKIDNRVYKKIYNNSYRVDPLRCMEEKTFMMTNTKMHHYSLTIDTIKDKLKHNVGKVDPSNNERWEIMLKYIEHDYDGLKAYTMSTYGGLVYIDLGIDSNSPWN